MNEWQCPSGGSGQHATEKLCRMRALKRPLGVKLEPQGKQPSEEKSLDCLSFSVLRTFRERDVGAWYILNR